MSDPVSLHNHARLDEATLARLGAIVREQTSLERVLDWGRTHEPPLAVDTVVTQDEYTHDVVVPFAAGLVLVYDTT